jgi:Trk-type K+ transport system membrane component
MKTAWGRVLCITDPTIIIWSALTGRTNGRRAKRKSNDKKMNKKMVKKYFLIIFLYIFLKFLAVGDSNDDSLNKYHHQIVSQLFLIFLQ